VGLSDLFEVFFSNIVIVVLVIGGIISFLKRNIGNNNNPSRPINKKAASRPVNPRTEVSTPIEPYVETEPQRSTKRIEVLKKHKEFKEPNLNGIERRSRINRTTKSRTNKRKKRLVSNKPDHVIQGVIWSEILGPPRSKVPHQSRRVR
jgi:hypothetical protein